MSIRICLILILTVIAMKGKFELLHLKMDYFYKSVFEYVSKKKLYYLRELSFEIHKILLLIFLSFVSAIFLMQLMCQEMTKVVLISLIINV